MKIAVCVSGIMCDNAMKLLLHNQHFFPNTSHFYYGTWVGHEIDWPMSEYTHTFPEPELHYNPALENSGDFSDAYKKELNQARNKSNTWKHRSKQILAHAYMLESISNTYDMIVRLRFDSQIMPSISKIGIERLIDESYSNKKAIGCFIPKGQNKSYRNDYERLSVDDKRRKQHLVDHMIIHPRELFDTKRAHMLHKEKRLMVAEFGWWQMLSELAGDNHECIRGIVGVDKDGNF